MRVSANLRDTRFQLDLSKISVLLNNQLQSYVVAAAEEAGMVVTISVDSLGRPINNGTHMETHKRFGLVEIFFDV
jgi:hypothetical protein